MIGLGIMVGGGLTGGRQLGNLIALWLPLSYSISVILVRRSKQPDMLVALCLAAGVATLSTLPFVGEFSISGHDLGVSLYLGIFQVGAGFILMILGARYVPAAQVGLLALVEPVLGPLWAWFVVAEMPAQVTLLGGAIILGAVGLDGIISIARKNPGSADGNR
jgi:drug/metabolite transporter (DMT)-like permease